MNARVMRVLIRTPILLIAAVPALKQVLILLTRGAGRVVERLTESPARTLQPDPGARAAPRPQGALRAGWSGRRHLDALRRAPVAWFPWTRRGRLGSGSGRRTLTTRSALVAAVLSLVPQLSAKEHRLTPEDNDGSATAVFTADTLLTGQFKVEISGIPIPQEQIRSAEIGDITVDLVATGVYSGQENFSPAVLRYGDLVITTQGSRQLSSWMANAAGMGPRSVSVIALGRDGRERFRYNVYEVVPVSVTPGSGGVETLRAKVGRVELDGKGGGTEGGAGTVPVLWEWSGVFDTGSLLRWTEGPVSIATGTDGGIVQRPVRGGGNFWTHSAETLGVSGYILDAVQLLEAGEEDRRSHTHISRDASGAETSRRNYYDAFISRFRFPRFDRDSVNVVSETVTFLSPSKLAR